MVSDILKQNIEVLTPTGFKPIENVFKTEKKLKYEVTLSSGKTLKCADKHLIKKSDGFCHTKDLKIGDLVLTKHGSEEVTSLVNTGIEQEFYDITVADKNHEYYANDILSHNSGTGKSFCLGRAIKDAQDKGYLVIFFDTENAITDKFMKNVGVNTDLLYYQPIDQISDLKNYVIHMTNEIKTKFPKQKIMIALDSLGNLSCAQEKAFIEKKTDSMTQGAREREIKSMLKELTKFCGLHQMPFVFTNHSMKPQDTNMLPMYVKDKQGGGKQATYMASATVLMSKKKLKAEDASSSDKKDVDGKKKVGNILMCESTKNRLCPEEEKVEIYLSFASGPNKYYGLEVDAVHAGCFERINDKNYYVKHLDKKIHVSKLYVESVFTQEILDKIDEYCLKTYTYTKMGAQKPEDELEVEILDEEDDSSEET